MSDSSLGEILEEIKESRIVTYVDLAAAALILYDVVLTSGEEISYIWRRKFNFGSLLYVLVKYTTLLVAVLTVPFDVLNFTDIPLNVLIAVSWPERPFNLLSGLSANLALVARAYAVSGGNKVVAVVLGLLYCAYMGINIALITFSIESPSPMIASLVSASSIVVMITDAAVMAVTGYYAFGIRSRLRDVFGEQSLMVIFFRQGVIRFIIIFLWNLKIGITSRTSSSVLSGVDVDLEKAISAILLYHFILELKRWDEKPNGTEQINTMTTFKARVHAIDETIIDEFGNDNMGREARSRRTVLNPESITGMA